MTVVASRLGIGAPFVWVLRMPRFLEGHLDDFEPLLVCRRLIGLSHAASAISFRWA
jgi:hypothetical protein